MKKVINGKLYNSEKCEELTSRNHYNNGNYSGTTYLLRANDGTLLEHRDSNGQDLYLRDSFELAEDDAIDNYEPEDNEIERLVELGIIEEI